MDFFLKTAVISGQIWPDWGNTTWARIWPDWGNTTWADMARLGSIGLRPASMCP